ncbi:hypothetical protein Bhyg_15952, partial [Pseudolycoriella hygida]
IIQNQSHVHRVPKSNVLQRFQFVGF